MSTVIPLKFTKFTKFSLSRWLDLPSSSAMVASLRLGFPNAAAAVSHCFLLVGYSLPVSSCRTLELVTRTTKSGFVIGTRSSNLGLRKKNSIKVLSSLYRPLFILSQTSVQSTKNPLSYHGQSFILDSGSIPLSQCLQTTVFSPLVCLKGQTGPRLHMFLIKNSHTAAPDSVQQDITKRRTHNKK
ncbi:hypothetical protein pdam_00023198 [Pocillopora damicornis]|uniref:Uncharacterized protein n=1 Tax=Pocillopora damicornis TaxID=46731 RepID=A0A3M6UVG5_POCDA|nr:hypothetical protein pdam_00023198 [Pocillopora damicornis]